METDKCLFESPFYLYNKVSGSPSVKISFVSADRRAAVVLSVLQVEVEVKVEVAGANPLILDNSARDKRVRTARDANGTTALGLFPV